MWGFQELIDFGRVYRVETIDSEPGDVYTLSYTSGTTGNPKGIVINHSNIVAQIAGINEFFRTYCTDVHLSYLPICMKGL